MAKGIIKKLEIVRRNLSKKMELPEDASIYARGMRSEGWLGGYRAAIQDVELALSGNHPTTRGLWDDWDDDDR